MDALITGIFRWMKTFHLFVGFLLQKRPRKLQVILKNCIQKMNLRTFVPNDVTVQVGISLTWINQTVRMLNVGHVVTYPNRHSECIIRCLQHQFSINQFVSIVDGNGHSWVIRTWNKSVADIPVNCLITHAVSFTALSVSLRCFWVIHCCSKHCRGGVAANGY